MCLRTLGIGLALVIAQSRAWSFAELLGPPSAAELRLVDDSWAKKSWDVAGATRIGTATVPVGSIRFDAAVYTFTLNGSPRCGAVLVPPNPAGRLLAGLVDIGDIRWDYPDRDLTNGPYVARILGDRAREYALIVPCARGMGLRVGPLASAAGGDRRDAWEGAAEDAMAFLTVALSQTPHIDAARVGVYGYSRGGGVALIAGERDPRIKAVLAFAPPTDFFVAMGRPGVDWAGRLDEASRAASLPADTRESQFLDWFVRGREALPLTELRRADGRCVTAVLRGAAAAISNPPGRGRCGGPGAERDHAPRPRQRVSCPRCVHLRRCPPHARRHHRGRDRWRFSRSGFDQFAINGIDRFWNNAAPGKPLPLKPGRHDGRLLRRALIQPEGSNP